MKDRTLDEQINAYLDELMLDLGLSDVPSDVDDSAPDLEAFSLWGTHWSRAREEGGQ